MTPSQLGSDINEVIVRHGMTATFRNWNLGSEVYNAADYDNATFNTGSALVTSGAIMVQPLAKSDQVYVEAGLLRQDDLKGFIVGSISLTAHAEITVGNNGSTYDVLPKNIERWDMSGTTIYQIVYLRKQLQ